MLIVSKICDEFIDQEVVDCVLWEVDYFFCLYECYELVLLWYVCCIIGVGQDGVEDILQDVFIKIWCNLRGYDFGMKLSSWFYCIVYNEVIFVLCR